MADDDKTINTLSDLLRPMELSMARIESSQEVQTRDIGELKTTTSEIHRRINGVREKIDERVGHHEQTMHDATGTIQTARRDSSSNGRAITIKVPVKSLVRWILYALAGLGILGLGGAKLKRIVGKRGKTCLDYCANPRAMLAQELRRNSGNIAQTAYALGIARYSLYRIIKRWKFWPLVNELRREAIERRRHPIGLP
jgi:hypothetical protein